MATEDFNAKRAGGIGPDARELSDEELEGVAGGGHQRKCVAYRCDDCGTTRFADPQVPVTTCEVCGGHMSQQLSYCPS